MGNLVVKSNALIEASYSLNVVEQRVILLAILKARELDMEIGLGTVIRVYADNYAHTYGISKDMAYKALKSAVLELINAKFRWVEQTKKGLKYTISNFMDTVSYMDGEGCVELIFGSQLIPQITDLTRLFTSYEIEQTRNLNRYGLRLYELLVRWRATGKVVVTLAELRSRLGLLDDEYKQMSNFKVRVLDMAIAEINEYTDIDVKYEQQKQGRKIVGFIFSFNQKNNAKTPKTDERDQNTTDLFTSLTDKQLARIANSKKFIADYGELVSPNNPANQSTSAWISHMVEWLKKEPERFTKRPAQEYLDDEQQVRF